MNNMGKFLKQAKKMQEKMEQIQEEVANSLIEVETGGGALQITITGDGFLHSLKIDPEVIDKDDAEGLEDLLLTAINQAIKESKAFSDDKTKSVTGDMPLPKGLNL